ncbi:hypothetical protein SAMN05661012_04495 [Chitinophaga sancti]|uniref:Uncharacterized protein n=1 Tax=Chitinophaga sancti TaxID=1004 RepID=A0A1K1RYS0_9BACT|nr:hypothetical protein SAMN05661012_04495 [Chitinophaga sancti]
MFLQVKKRKILKSTDNSRTYNLIHKRMHAKCSYCKWHSTFFKSCFDNPFPYFLYKDDGTDKSIKSKFYNHPNWKIVSKNNKQWMKKRFLSRKTIMCDGSLYIELGWR